ncbi:MAG: hypothetical protein GWO24_27230, partial [Akkermansiaceae bacterium]|nr:hypothetical protein [Akkermansiaceae bacterium]
YNLGKPDGLFSGIPGAGADAAVVLTGSSGPRHYSGTFDLSGFATAPSVVSGYDYLVLGFARNIRSAGAPGVLIENVVLSMPGAGGTELWSFKA